MEKITKEKLQEKLFGAPLSDEELETVSGGTNLGHISCSNPNCNLYRSRYFGGYGPKCLECGSPMEFVEEGFPV